MQVDQVGALLVRHAMDIWLICSTDLPGQISPVRDWICKTYIVSLVNGLGSNP